MSSEHTTATVRVNADWMRDMCRDLGGVNALAESIGADRATIYRHLSGRMEASPRLIGAVLTRFPICFDDAFDVVDKPARNQIAGVAA